MSETMENMSRVFSWKDRQSWPTGWSSFDCEPNDYQLAAFGEILCREYDSIRCFHAARPIDVESYYKTGLRLTDFAELVRHAKTIFDMPVFPSVSESEIDQAVAGMGYSDHGKTFVALDDRNLVENAGHYLIYGSEYIMAIAAHLPADRAVICQQLLKTIGTPTVYELDVPVERVSLSDLNQLAWHIGNEESGPDTPGLIDFTFILSEALPGDYIVGHSHPREIRDWHNGGATYVWRSKD